jgi:hypothetical protein
MELMDRLHRVASLSPEEFDQWDMDLEYVLSFNKLLTMDLNSLNSTRTQIAGNWGFHVSGR